MGLNTGRPESIRQETIFSLNALGEEYKVEFPDRLLWMKPGGWEDDVLDGKVEGIRHFRDAGYHVCAFIDNEPANLEAVARAFPDEEILLLHADTLFESRRDLLPDESVSGVGYDLRAVASRDRLPGHVSFVWRGIDDRRELERFLLLGRGVVRARRRPRRRVEGRTSPCRELGLGPRRAVGARHARTRRARPPDVALRPRDSRGRFFRKIRRRRAKLFTRADGSRGRGPGRLPAPGHVLHISPHDNPHREPGFRQSP